MAEQPQENNGSPFSRWRLIMAVFRLTMNDLTNMGFTEADAAYCLKFFPEYGAKKVICERLDISFNWWLTGDGKMFTGEVPDLKHMEPFIIRGNTLTSLANVPNIADNKELADYKMRLENEIEQLKSIRDSRMLPNDDASINTAMRGKFDVVQLISILLNQPIQNS